MGEEPVNKKEIEEKIEQGLEVGRILGAVKRAGFDPELIKKIAKKYRMSPAELIMTAVEHYDKTQELISADPKCLEAGIKLARTLLKEAVSILMDLSELFGSGMVQSFMRSALEAIRQSRMGEAPESQQAMEEQALETELEIRRMKAEIMKPMLQSIMPTLLQIMNTLASRMAPAGQVPKTSISTGESTEESQGEGHQIILE